MKIKSVGIIGLGQMGAGIAQVFATAGVSTYVYDAQAGATEKGVSGIKKRLERLVEKATISAADRDQTVKLIQPASTLTEFKAVDLVIEAIVENTEIKTKLFKELDTICKPETIFASNTSSISITKLAAATSRPEKTVGMHFMNPVPVMKLVELIRGLQTSDATYTLTKETVEALGKVPVTAKQDFPGFIVNRILIPMLNEAVYVLMEGIADPTDIDQAMKLGCNQPMGPLELADFVGLDTCLYISQILHRELGDSKYRPCPLLVKYVEAGWLGRKTGRGFYQYNQ
ncbi:3-hydroxybutyryl-CoA dehydrogenase [bacterium]|nr:3-hydroxybutyryl-CoA dehydrogenase [bacterium]